MGGRCSVTAQVLGGQTREPLFSPLGSLPCCLGKEKGPGKNWPGIPKGSRTNRNPKVSVSATVVPLKGEEKEKKAPTSNVMRGALTYLSPGVKRPTLHCPVLGRGTALYWAEVEVLFLLGLAYPVPIAHVLQAFFEIVLGCLIVTGSFLGLTIGEFK